ncbi:uncharacterized protein LOC123425106 [Hordeum vulgare subsp. vulgare]|nr:uncharacterized protein LOC123425106 [Hordeum vulgare subsp. vulgare]
MAGNMRGSYMSATADGGIWALQEHMARVRDLRAIWGFLSTRDQVNSAYERSRGQPNMLCTANSAPSSGPSDRRLFLQPAVSAAPHHHAGRTQPRRPRLVARRPCLVTRRHCPALLPAAPAESCPFANLAGRIPAARLRSCEATTRSNSSNSNRRRTVHRPFRRAVMNSDEFRTNSGKLHGGVLAPARFDWHKENLPEGPKHHHPAQPAAVSSAASRGRSRAGCASKERGTPEGVNMAEHGFRFRFTFPQPDYGEYGADFGEEEEYVPRQRKPPQVRNALREKRVAFRQKTGRHHAEVALRKYNRANNTKFELVEVPVIREFWEFGGGCIHYNFTAKPAEDHHHHSADADSTKLFFSEVNSAFHGETDVVLCCIVGEHDNGHCYGCEGFKPTVVHPSSQAYGGGSSTCIDFAGSDGSSESD